MKGCFVHSKRTVCATCHSCGRQFCSQCLTKLGEHYYCNVNEACRPPVGSHQIPSQDITKSLGLESSYKGVKSSQRRRRGPLAILVYPWGDIIVIATIVSAITAYWVFYAIRDERRAKEAEEVEIKRRLEHSRAFETRVIAQQKRLDALSGVDLDPEKMTLGVLIRIFGEQAYEDAPYGNTARFSWASHAVEATFYGSRKSLTDRDKPFGQ